MKVICGFTIPITMYGLPPSIDDLLKCMEQVKARGFGELELEIEAGNKEYVDRWDEVVEKSKEIDLKIPSIMAVSYEMFSLSKKLQDASIQYFDQSCEMNRRIGSSLPSVFICLLN
jgi:sugar phosphate isomerase/epimerase